MKKILIIGCSNGLGIHHAFRDVFQKTQSSATISRPYEDKNKFPDEILEDNYCRYTNFSMAGAGNTYIRHRLFEYLKKDKPDYVYLQFSGLVRRDVCLNLDSIDIFLEEFKNNFYKITDEKIYLIGGSVVNSSNSTVYTKFFSLMYNINDVNNNNDLSLQDIFCCLSILKKYKIKHNWTFYYDPTNPPTEESKKDGTIDKIPDFINTENILPNPLNFAINNGYTVDDGVHYGYNPFLRLLQQHKDKIHLNLDHK